VKEIEKLLSQGEAIKNKTWIKDYLNGKVIKYKEIIPNCMR
jgi:hypothetical protein